MEDLISGLLNTALDAASNLLHQPNDNDNDHDSASRPHHSDSSTIDRSSWAEIVEGPNEDSGKNAQYNHLNDAHSFHDAKHFHSQHKQQSYIPESPCKQQVLDNDNAGFGNWQKGDGSESCAAAEYYQHPPPPMQSHKVSAGLRQEFRKHPSKQEYAKSVGSAVDTEPTQEELRNLPAACNRLWELDINRLTPGQDYEINCGEGKKVYEKEDMAANSLFRYVNRDVFGRPTYARFYALLDNYSASEGVCEQVTAEKKQEEIAFIEEISRTAPIQYLFKYLASRRIVSQSPQDFKQHLHSLWFDLYGRGGSHGSSSAFEHVFVGEIKNGPEKQVSGFHNWIKFYVEEAAGRVDYQGYILPRRRSHNLPDAHSQLLSIQFEWNGVRKPVSSTFIGVSPEFELALYTLCFYEGQEDNYVDLGPYNVNIKCYHFDRKRMGSTFPISED